MHDLLTAAHTKYCPAVLLAVHRNQLCSGTFSFLTFSACHFSFHFNVHGDTLLLKPHPRPDRIKLSLYPISDQKGKFFTLRLELLKNERPLISQNGRCIVRLSIILVPGSFPWGCRGEKSLETRTSGRVSGVPLHDVLCNAAVIKWRGVAVVSYEFASFCCWSGPAEKALCSVSMVRMFFLLRSD